LGGTQNGMRKSAVLWDFTAVFAGQILPIIHPQQLLRGSPASRVDDCDDTGAPIT
jgi:hypothetical protein